MTNRILSFQFKQTREKISGIPAKYVRAEDFTAYFSLLILKFLSRRVGRKIGVLDGKKA